MASAQEAASPAEKASLEEIVVTAQRREQKLVDVPVSVAVTSGETLAQGNITSLDDLSNRLPGVKIATGAAASLLNIRGVGSGQNAGFEQAVGTFVDGVYRGRSRAIAAALFDIERIEVLRGPQTTFFGNNVIAGALNIVTRKPKSELKFNYSALYSPSDDSYSLEAGGDLPVSDTLSLRVAGRVYGGEGWARNTRTGANVPHTSDWIGRISAVWRPTDNLRTDLRIDNGNFRDTGTPYSEIVGCPPDASIYGPARGQCLKYINSGLPIDGKLDYQSGGSEAFTYYDFTEVALTNSLDIGSGNLNFITGYFHHDADLKSDLTPFPVGGAQPGTATALPVRNIEDTSQYSQEIRYQSDQSQPMSYMAGIYYARENVNVVAYGGQYTRINAVTGNTAFSSRIPFEQHTNTWSAFGSFTAELIQNRLYGDLGLRYTRVNKSVNRSAGFGATTSPGPESYVPLPLTQQTALAFPTNLNYNLENYANPKKDDSRLMPSIKVRYKFSDDIVSYLSYTSGFKAGGFASGSRNYVFNRETVDAYEAGLKATLFDARLFTTLAIFRADYDDLQEATNTPTDNGVISVVANAGKARSQGVEFSATFLALQNLKLNTEVTYLDSTYRSFPSTTCTALQALLVNPCSQDMSGKPRAYAPKWTGAVGATYTLGLADYLVKVAPSMYFSSKYFEGANADPLTLQPYYHKVDLRIGFGPGNEKWEVAFIGKNLNNKATAYQRVAVPGAAGSVAVFPDPPRSIAFQVSGKF